MLTYQWYDPEVQLPEDGKTKVLVILKCTEGEDYNGPHVARYFPEMKDWLVEGVVEGIVIYGSDSFLKDNADDNHKPCYTVAYWHPLPLSPFCVAYIKKEEK